jgi:hypothetical protein
MEFLLRSLSLLGYSVQYWIVALLVLAIAWGIIAIMLNRA